MSAVMLLMTDRRGIKKQIMSITSDAIYTKNLEQMQDNPLKYSSAQSVCVCVCVCVCVRQRLCLVSVMIETL